MNHEITVDGRACCRRIAGHAGLANAQDTMPAPQAQQQQNPATPAASSDMNSQSYGGVPATNTQSGRRAAEKCRIDPQCNIFFGS